MEITAQYRTLRINAPELKRNRRFVKWLNDATVPTSDRASLATWHRVSAKNGANTPLGEYSDIFVWKDKGDEGSNSDMPASVWKKICAMAGRDFDGLIWVSFL